MVTNILQRIPTLALGVKKLFREVCCCHWRCEKWCQNTSTKSLSKVVDLIHICQAAQRWDGTITATKRRHKLCTTSNLCGNNTIFNNYFCVVLLSWKDSCTFINQCSATSCMTQYISPILTKNLNLTWQFVYYQYIILYRIIWWPHWEMLWGQNTIKLLNKTLMWLFLRHGCSMFGVLLDVVFHENEIRKSSFCRKSKPESCCAHQSLSQPWLSGETQSPSFVLLILSLHHHFVILLCHAQNCLFSVTVAIKVTFISRYFKTLSTCQYEFLA